MEEDVDENAGKADEDKIYFEANGYILGKQVLVRADHHKFTADQIARHEIGHDKIAKGEIDVDAVRARLIEIVGEENVDLLAENYAEAYEGSRYNEEQIWVECICDSLGDMNIFATNAEAAELMTRAIPEIKKAIKETSKGANQTRGAPEGYVSSGGIAINAKQALLLSQLSNDQITVGTEISGKRDITFNAIGISDNRTKQAWIDAGLVYEIDSDEGSYYAIPDEYILAEREQRQHQQRQNSAKASREFYNEHENFVEDKYYQRQIDKIDELKQGSYITVGEVKKGSPLNKVGFPDTVVYFDVSKIVKEMSTRTDVVPPNIMKLIPKVLDNPIVITEFVDRSGLHSANVYGHLYIGSSPVVVGIMMSQTQKGSIISKIQTVHPNRNALKEMTDDKILYLSENKKETKAWFQSLGTQKLPLGGNKFGFIRSISQSDALVNASTKKIDGHASRELDFSAEEMSDEDYRNFGWVRDNDVISAGYWKTFTTNFAQAVTKLGKYPKSKFGEFMIEVYDFDLEDRLQISDIIVFAKGTIKSPVVTKIIQIYEYDSKQLDKYRRYIYDLGRRGIQPQAGEFFELYRNVDFTNNVNIPKSYGENDRYSEQLGIYGGRSSRTTEETSEIGKASRELDVIDYMDELAEREGREIVEPKVMSDREILVNALESIAQDDAERNKLKEYKANIEKLKRILKRYRAE